jgi:hypothetical protein
VFRISSQTRAATATTTTGAGSIPGIASPVKKAMNSGAMAPPGVSMISRIRPWMMNIVDSVTTIGCNRT